MDQILRGFESLVVLVVAPGAIDGLASFERQSTDNGIVVEVRGLSAWQVFLEHLEILAWRGRAMMIVADHRRRLQVVDHLVSLSQTPVGVGTIPPSIEPDAADGTVVGQ